MSLVVRKCVFGSFRPDQTQTVCSATEASMRLEIFGYRNFWDIILSRQRKTKALNRLRGCAGWCAPLLFAYDIRHVFSRPGSNVFFSCRSHLLELCVYSMFMFSPFQIKLILAKDGVVLHCAHGSASNCKFRGPQFNPQTGHITFVEIDYEIISSALIHQGQLSVTGEWMCTACDLINRPDRHELNNDDWAVKPIIIKKNKKKTATTKNSAGGIYVLRRENKSMFLLHWCFSISCYIMYMYQWESVSSCSKSCSVLMKSVYHVRSILSVLI